MNQLHAIFNEQQFANEYELANGVELHRENGSRFQIPPDVIKRHLTAGQFVELRIDSPRFSIHEEDAVNCSCPNCDGEFSKPILRHEQPATLAPLPKQEVPSRGWGEDFWVKIEDQVDDYFIGPVDNHLVESRLHDISLGDQIVFHRDHILALHPIHRSEIVSRMDASDLKELATWLGEMNR
ncbi:hypothetical protein OAF98_03655 [Planctomicrobium sp.]|jgi:hypothetical protein|nr:hypothetical protein [Planctomicrobium sp.]MBT5019374.1 hypothetical protein [Planctomicrobium sp.]MDB4731423.1 hypothetical protein [bacterium]MDB4743559.1 hypothetical protein [Planctomicrobium sp.]MDB4802425.1 hypothetical protein [bacterium]